MSKRATPHGYAVGYGKPPKATQFKKGQSGNPKGRAKRHQQLQDRSRRRNWGNTSHCRKGASPRGSQNRER